MPEKTKRNENTPKRTGRKDTEKPCDENEAIGEEGNWSRDQQRKSYYYDDSYGYEIYIPNEDDETENSD